ncbi:MAG: rhodanese-like domain-containing protein [Alphaproteobacteria bacterium]
MTFKTIDVNQLKQIETNSIILDVRTQMEHAEKHLKCKHIHIPLDELNPSDFIAKNNIDKNTCVYILCRSGKRAEQAALKFNFETHPNIYVIEGGILACEDCDHEIAGYNVIDSSCYAKLKGPISLERQVRITAGVFVAIGALLGLFVHQLFTVIPLFVGCGLIFAGITDLCGMALVLAKAPWNKRS